VLAKVFARSEKMTDLYALLDESDAIVLPEVEPVFRAARQYSALCKMYSKRDDDAALLDVWSKCVTFRCISLFLTIYIDHFCKICRLVEGEWTDPEIPDPLSAMFALLTERRNRPLTQQWGIWLAGKDAERALKVRHIAPFPHSVPCLTGRRYYS
jgi:vacuolar protein sorting-associated protein 3